MARNDTSRRWLTRLLAVLGVASGITLIARPQQVADRVAPAFPRERRWLVRALGGRLLAGVGVASGIALVARP